MFYSPIINAIFTVAGLLVYFMPFPWGVQLTGLAVAVSAMILLVISILVRGTYLAADDKRELTAGGVTAE